jgi:hypothetical protein
LEQSAWIDPNGLRSPVKLIVCRKHSSLGQRFFGAPASKVAEFAKGVTLCNSEIRRKNLEKSRVSRFLPQVNLLCRGYALKFFDFRGFLRFSGIRPSCKKISPTRFLVRLSQNLLTWGRSRSRLFRDIYGL